MQEAGSVLQASEHQKEGSIYLFGQESQLETYAVAEDLLLKGRGW